MLANGTRMFLGRKHPVTCELGRVCSRHERSLKNAAGYLRPEPARPADLLATWHRPPACSYKADPAALVPALQTPRATRLKVMEDSQLSFLHKKKS